MGLKYSLDSLAAWSGRIRQLALPVELPHTCCYHESDKNMLFIFGGHDNSNIYTYNFNTNTFTKINQIKYVPIYRQCAIKFDELDDTVIISGNDKITQKHYFYLYKLLTNRIIYFSSTEGMKPGLDCCTINSNTFVLTYRNTLEIYSFDQNTITKIKEMDLGVSYTYRCHRMFCKNNLLYVFLGMTEDSSSPQTALRRIRFLSDNDLVPHIDKMRQKYKFNTYVENILREIQRTNNNMSPAYKTLAGKRWDFFDFYLTCDQNNFWQNIKIYSINENDFTLNEMPKQSINITQPNIKWNKWHQVFQYGLVEYKDNIIVIGGVGNERSIWLYNMTLNRWTISPIELPTDINASATLLLNDTLCIVGGFKSSKMIYKIAMKDIGLGDDSFNFSNAILYYFAALLLSFLVTCFITYLLSMYIDKQSFEIIILFFNFSSYHSESLSSASMVFIITLWIAVELFEMTQLTKNINGFQSFIMSLPVIVVLCGGIIISSITDIRNKNEIYRQTHPKSPSNSGVTIINNNTNTNNNTNNNTNSNTNTNKNTNKNTNVNKNEQRNNLFSMFNDAFKIGLTGTGFLAGFNIINTLLMPIIIFGAIKWVVLPKCNDFIEYANTQQTKLMSNIHNTQKNVQKRIQRGINDTYDIIGETKFFIQSYVKYIKEKKLFGFVINIFVLFIGCWCGMYLAPFIVAPYYIPSNHFKILYLQQNVAYSWWILYFAKAPAQIIEYIYVALVMLPLNMYLFEIFNGTENVNDAMYLLYEVGFISICYFLSQIVAASMMHR
eukprot:325385_1